MRPVRLACQCYFVRKTRWCSPVFFAKTARVSLPCRPIRVLLVQELRVLANLLYEIAPDFIPLFFIDSETGLVGKV